MGVRRRDPMHTANGKRGWILSSIFGGRICRILKLIYSRGEGKEDIWESVGSPAQEIGGNERREICLGSSIEFSFRISFVNL